MELLNLFKDNDENDLSPLQNNEFNDENINSLLNIKNDFDQNLTELDFFSNYQNLEDNTVLSSINKTQTSLGKQTLIKFLHDYKFNKSKIRKIKNVVSFVNNNDLNYDLSIINKTLPDVLWFFKDVDENLKVIFDQLYFNSSFDFVNNVLNNSKFLLNISSIYSIYINPLTPILGPIITLIVPLIIFRIYKINIPFSLIFTVIKMYFKKITSPKQLFSVVTYLGFYLYSTYHQFRHSYNIKKMLNILHNKIISLQLFLNKVTDIYSDLKEFFIMPDISNILYSLKNIPNENKLFLLPGNILYFINRFRKSTNILSILKDIGEIDVMFSVLSLIKTKKYTFAKFINKKKPYVYLKKMAHPSLQNPVTNNVKIKNKNIIITGPNAAGKSTFIKGLTINIILAQSLGICCASNAKLSNFDYIRTHLNTPDRINTQSLFEAEMYKCKEIIDEIKKNGKCLIVLDELFSSTNYKEGFSGSAAIVKKIGTFDNVSTIITTHYSDLPKYAKKYGYLNYKFPVQKSNDKLNYTYKIKKGISNDFVALDILKINNYDEDIINDAVDIMKTL